MCNTKSASKDVLFTYFNCKVKLVCSHFLMPWYHCVLATPVTEATTTTTKAPTTTTSPSEACIYEWGMSNDRYIQDNEISIIDHGQHNTQPQTNLRPQNSGAVVTKVKHQVSGAIIDLNESLTAGLTTTLISEIKVTGNIKYVNIKYKATDDQANWTPLFMNKKIIGGERLFTFTPMRVGQVKVAIREVTSGKTAKFHVDILGCFQVNCKLITFFIILGETKSTFFNMYHVISFCNTSVLHYQVNYKVLPTLLCCLPVSRLAEHCFLFML
jgi:hypothetical protein